MSAWTEKECSNCQRLPLMVHHSSFSALISFSRISCPKSSNCRSVARSSQGDTWDLSSLFADDDAWETAFRAGKSGSRGYEKFRGQLGEDAKSLAACFKFDVDMDRAGERLGTYAFLKTAEDTANSTYQRMQGRYQNAASRAGQIASYIRPEIMAIPAAKMKTFLAAKELAPYRLALERLLRYKPHTLSDGEEKLLAMQSEMSATANQVFRQLNNADLKFGTIKNDRGETVELSHASFSALLHSPQRSVREAAFHQYYQQFAAHENTLAATLAGSVQRDVYYARARGYPGALAAALFPDNVPLTVYDNLIASVRQQSAGLAPLLRFAAAEDEAARTSIITTPTCRS